MTALCGLSGAGECKYCHMVTSRDLLRTHGYHNTCVQLVISPENNSTLISYRQVYRGHTPGKVLRAAGRCDKAR